MFVCHSMTSATAIIIALTCHNWLDVRSTVVLQCHRNRCRQIKTISKNSPFSVPPKFCRLSFYQPWFTSSNWTERRRRRKQKTFSNEKTWKTRIRLHQLIDHIQYRMENTKQLRYEKVPAHHTNLRTQSNVDSDATEQSNNKTDSQFGPANFIAQTQNTTIRRTKTKIHRKINKYLTIRCSDIGNYQIRLLLTVYRVFINTHNTVSSSSSSSFEIFLVNIVSTFCQTHENLEQKTKIMAIVCGSHERCGDDMSNWTV